jgi:hypothetical protein
MDIQSSIDATRRGGDGSERRLALVTSFSLLLMAVLAGFAQFGVLKTLVVPTDATATVINIAASPGLLQAGITAFAVVVLLDVLVAWGFYVLLRPVDQRLALLVGSLRIVYGGIVAFALLNLVDAARFADGAMQSSSLQSQVATSVRSFDTGWHLALGIFGLHLLGLGVLLFRFAAPRLLAALVILAGAGYLADAIGTLVIADYAPTIAAFTFAGEALLIPWLFWRAARGSRSLPAAIGTADHAAAAAAS